MSRQVQLRRGLPVEARDLSRLDPAALEKVRAEVAPSPRGADELHDLLLSTLVHRPQADWQEWFQQLVATAGPWGVRSRRVGRRQAGTASRAPLWCATERRPWAEALFPGGRVPSPTTVAWRRRDSRPTAGAHGRRGAGRSTSPPPWPFGATCELTGPVT